MTQFARCCAAMKRLVVDIFDDDRAQTFRSLLKLCLPWTLRDTPPVRRLFGQFDHNTFRSSDQRLITKERGEADLLQPSSGAADDVAARSALANIVDYFGSNTVSIT
jgi:hypothetical protein